MKRKLNFKHYIAIVFLAVLIIFMIVKSGKDESERFSAGSEEMKRLLSTDYISYESYGVEQVAYAILKSEYEEKGYTGTETKIVLSPQEADTDGMGELVTGIADYQGETLCLREDVNAEWTFEVEESALYSVVLDYAGIDGNGAKIQRQLLIDGELPCQEATNISFYRYFIESEPVKVNVIGNEVWPSQEEVLLWQTQAVYDSNGFDAEPMYFYLEEGTHTIALTYVDQPIAIREVRLEGKQDLPTYAEVKQTYEAKGYKKANAEMGAYIEGEESAWRSDSIIRRESNSDPGVVPFSLTHRVLNTVGGGRWNKGEQSVSWSFEVAESGLYEIAIKVNQNKKEGMPSYRKVEIDGEVPFEEFLEYKFPFNKSWYGEVLSDDNGEPYLVYLEKGTHELTLTGQLGDISSLLKRTENDVAVLSEIYRDITKVTGTEPDVNYEYDLYRVMPELSEELAELADSVEICADILKNISNATTSAENGYRSIVDTLREFSEDVDTIPRAIGELENAQSSLGSYVMELKATPLSIDYLEILSPEEEFEVQTGNFFEKLGVSVVNFLLSFTKDYDAIGTTEEDGTNTVLEVWIGRGTEWGEIMKEMIDESFTPQTGIYVNLNVMPSGQLSSGGVNALMLSLNSGTAPDVALSVDYTTPAEFAFRDAAADLTQFEDFDEVASWFYKESLVPYKYREGVYAIPETMDFTVMFYRKDILKQLELEIPQTWADLYQGVLPVLYQNSMSFNLPVDSAVSTSSPAALRGFTMMLLQNGAAFYSEDGKASALDTGEAYQAFKMWTDWYSQYGIDEEASLFTRMRTGATPLGVGGYSDYIQFLTSAPELYGRWGITLVPGIKDENGVINREIGSISQTANMIMQQSDKKEAAWEFLKWWMSEETQVSYGRQLEAVIGETARWNTANKEAFFDLPWKTEDKVVIQAALESGREQYIVPGGYFTSRHVINAWNSVVVNAEKPREVLREAIKDINKELRNKAEEFGLQDVDLIPQEDGE